MASRYTFTHPKFKVSTVTNNRGPSLKKILFKKNDLTAFFSKEKRRLKLCLSGFFTNCF